MDKQTKISTHAELISASCGTCRFYCEGVCRRYPPIRLSNTRTFGEEILTDFDTANWPEGDVDDWCGEWKTGDYGDY